MNLIKISEIEDTLEKLQKSLLTDERHVYLFILGNQTKIAIEDLPRRIPGISLLWSGWSGPNWMRLLQFFIAGYGGVYEILDFSKLKDLVLEASVGGLVQVVITKTAIGRQLEELVAENGLVPLSVEGTLDWGEGNAFIEIDRDTGEVVDLEEAGYFSVRGTINFESSV